MTTGSDGGRSYKQCLLETKNINIIDKTSIFILKKKHHKTLYTLYLPTGRDGQNNCVRFHLNYV